MKKEGGSKELWISLSDIAYVLKKHKKLLIRCSTAVAACALFYTLTNHVSYKAEASFREKGKSHLGISPQSFTTTIFSPGATDSDALAVFKSRTVVAKAIQELGLQVSITPAPASPNAWPLRILYNLRTAYAHFNNEEKPIFQDIEKPLAARKVQYTAEKPLKLSAEFIGDEQFVINGVIGRLGQPVHLKEITLTLVAPKPDQIEGKTFTLDVQPLHLTTKYTAGALKAEVDKKDKTLLKLEFSHQDRIEGAKILNQIMASYQDFLQEEQGRHARMQIAYLEKREKESLSRLQDLMEGHASNVSSHVSSQGFADSEKAMEFLARAQEQYQTRLMGLELQLRKLKEVASQSNIHFDQAIAFLEDPAVNELLTKMAELKQRRDVVSLALSRRPADPGQERQLFAHQMKEWEGLKRDLSEVNHLIAELDTKGAINPSLAILERPRQLLDEWAEKLKSCQDHAEFGVVSESCRSYLVNYKRLLEVQEKMVREELAYQQEPRQDFEGIDLTLATELYVLYHKQMEEVEAQTRQIGFLLKQMDDESFELSSLSSVLNDRVALDMTSKASALVLALRDPGNRSAKEQERMREELTMQRGFLKMHLDQTRQLLGLRSDSLQEKIHGVQGVTLGIIYRQISFLEKQIADLVAARILGLEQEKKLYQEQMQLISKEMAALPKKWVSEQLVKQQMQQGQSIVSEMARLVESKNISANLEIVQSAPLDAAVAPILPNNPSLFFYALYGAFLGFFGACGWLFYKMLKEGVPITFHNLALAGQKVAGSLTKQAALHSLALEADPDLATLRRIVTFLDAPKTSSGSAFLALGGFGNYTPQLAELLALKRRRVLLIPLDFDTVPAAKEMPGLFQYLQGEAKRPKIVEEAGYDRVSSGEIYRFAPELISTTAFQDLIKEMHKSYDWILAYTSHAGNEAAVQQLMPYFDKCVITIGDERLTTYQELFDLPDSQEKLLFVLGA